MTFSGNIGYTRWYDRVPEMSQAVRIMEKLALANQRWIAGAIVGMMPLHEVPQRTDGLKKLGSEKIIGLMKSKGKRRWYDQDPLVHQAFNYLYLMNDTQRQEMAVKILICIKAIDAMRLSDQDIDAGYGLTKSIFSKPLGYLMRQTNFVIHTAEKPRGRISFALDAARQKPKLPSFPEGDNDPALSLVVSNSAVKEQTAVDNSIQSSGEAGMKIVRLKRVNPQLKMG